MPVGGQIGGAQLVFLAKWYCGRTPRCEKWEVTRDGGLRSVVEHRGHRRKGERSTNAGGGSSKAYKLCTRPRRSVLEDLNAGFGESEVHKVVVVKTPWQAQCRSPYLSTTTW